MKESLFIVLAQVNKEYFSKLLIDFEYNTYDIIDFYFVQKYEITYILIISCKIQEFEDDLILTTCKVAQILLNIEESY